MIPLPMFIDLEASSLASASYPIEVGWNNADGTIESHLIAPLPRWTDWSAAAEKLHGISRDELLEHGEAPALVCRRLNEALAGLVLYSDNPDYDGMWLEILFRAQYGSQRHFKVAHADDLLLDMLCPSGRNRRAALEELHVLKQQARQDVDGQHRAAQDVAYLLKLYDLTCAATGGPLKSPGPRTANARY